MLTLAIQTSKSISPIFISDFNLDIGDILIETHVVCIEESRPVSTLIEKC